MFKDQSTPGGFMDSAWNDILWRQMGAAMDMLENDIRNCPADLWEAHVWEEPTGYEGYSDYWYLAYHCIFWLDCYVSGKPDDFQPPAPYTLGEYDPAGALPERVYTPKELLTYLAYCREKGRQKIDSLTAEIAQMPVQFHWGELPYIELFLDSMRHTQEHGAQLNLFLGQQVGQVARWVTRTKTE
jgi:hypothetical protein